MPMKLLLAGVAALPLACLAVEAPASAPLAETVKERLAASPAPACIAVAVVAAETQEVLACTETIAAVPFDRHSAFEIGSITKGFTGLLLADMVLKGEVSLDDAASKYARPGAKLPTFEGRQITLRDLVTQTSGLPRLPPGMEIADPRNPYARFDADKLYEALARTEITRPIGSAPEYSNFAFMWLSEILARRAGKPFDVLLKERVLDPLGMTDSFFVPTQAQRERMVQPHSHPYEPTPAWDVPVDLAGVGMLRASLSDMERLAAALAGRLDTPLKEAIALALQPMRPADRGENSTGFAWITVQRGDVRFQWHNGGTGGSHSMLVVDPRTKTGFVVLANTDQSFDDLAWHLAYPAIPMLAKHVSLPIDPASAAQYAGRYDFGAPRVLEVFLDGARLMTRMTGQGPVELGREGTDKFFARGVEATLEFNRNQSGTVEAVTLRQNGREIRAARLP